MFEAGNFDVSVHLEVHLYLRKYTAWLISYDMTSYLDMLTLLESKFILLDT